MKIEISDFYKDLGYNTVYVAMNKEPRRVATLRKINGEMNSMSYAKYLYTSHYKCIIPIGYEIDHINGNKLDDRIENLQMISSTYNKRKDHKIKNMILLSCPICGKDFLYEKRNIKSHPNPCCSRKCGGIKSHMKLNTIRK